MGTGIGAAIPLSLQPGDKKYFTTGFFENFNRKKTKGEERYIVKNDILLENYRPFLIEFYQLIEEDIKYTTALTPDNIPAASSLDEFYDVFSEEKRGGYVPRIEKHRYGFSALGCEAGVQWMFYLGSYKAFLEEYSTLMHFERILSKAMKNPLAKSVKFGIFG